MASRTTDIVEIGQTCARYSVIMTQSDLSDLLSVFTPDGTYSAFGDTYPLSEFPDLVEAAPKGLYLTGPPAITFTGDDTATGVTPLCFVIDRTHDQRIGYYNDTYERTAGGWRIRTRSMTFIRRNGEHNHGIPHAHKNAATPPTPSTPPASA
ncbi:MAG: nuclear transport factor 2 family protein [Streptosporangiales bacterium]|nr:nuclear transport factor 2 family protein [Streptosporangiales bacterium]